MQGTRSRRLMGEINVVPYIDVMLVLLIIFMITAPLLTQGVKVDLPKGAAEPIEAQRVPPLVLSVDRAGRLYLNVGPDPQHPLDEAGVAARASATLQRNPQTQVLVKADSAVAYGRVVQAMVILQQAGARTVGFITEPLPPSEHRGS
ncbi:MAG: protein TolR [Gammaproteobacteria bacterium]|nr:protein TolR [Gammaproteobacteria bacterium]